MRILITGGAGFQGSHLAERWHAAGHKVTVLNTLSRQALENIKHFPEGITIVWGSVTDREVVEKTAREHEVVAHLAAHINVDQSLDGPHDVVAVNVDGTVNVLEAVRKSGARLIMASSCEVYGHAEQSPVTEKAELRPYSPYAASKAGADRMAFAYHKSFGLDVTIVRPSNVYGPRQKSGRGGAVIPIFANLACAGKPLTVFGTGTQSREYINVMDLVEAWDIILQRKDLNGAVLNIGTGETPSIREIADHVAKRFGVQVINGPARPGEVPGFRLDGSMMKRLGFTPRIKFWDGLDDYLDLMAPK
ncbi:MAG: NAD-dependent epimerase/dehydratase family protein [SAR202 cluster bacterium]|nr:NAD-dependent epimerase/dehydratase family protein [SAR202 cluster bacterium]